MEKVLIIKKHLVENVTVSDICDDYGHQPTVFYRWQKQFFESASLAFQPKKPKKDTKFAKRIAALEEKLIKNNEVEVV